MTSELSQMLDELMGKNRNAAPDEKSSDIHWSSKDVCKNFLCGFCPAELFTNTRSDLGPCEKIHDEAMRKAYLQSNRYMKMNYEADFLHYLQQCMQDVERRIKRNHQRLQLSEEKNQKVANPNKDVEDQINILTQKIEEMLQKIEQLGNEGNVEEAQGVMKLCDQLKEDREQLYGQKGNVLDAFSVQEKQMEVCEVCGAFLIVGDAQSRVDDHLMGKQHMGYAKIKAQIEELKEKLRNKVETPKVEEPPARHSSKRERRSRSRPEDGRATGRRSGSREPRKDRNYDRHHDKRSRDRDRDWNKSHSRDYDRQDRSRNGPRTYGSRGSGYHRSRDRDGHSTDHHHRSWGDRDRKSSHRSRSRDRDRRSRKHSRPRSGSNDRKDHKRNRRSNSREKQHIKEKEGKSAKESSPGQAKEKIVTEDSGQNSQVYEKINDDKNIPIMSSEATQQQEEAENAGIEHDEPPAPGTDVAVGY